MTEGVRPIPEGYSTVTPYLIVKDAARAIEFYQQAFGATEVFRMARPDGRVHHAEIQFGSSRVMLADEHPELNARSPQTLGGSPVSFAVYVEDVDAMVERAVAAGAKLTRPVSDQFYGDRTGGVEDPFGHHWYIATHLEDSSPEEIRRRMEAELPQCAEV